MDLISRLGAWALARPRVLVADAPGSDGLRWRVEAELDRRGWPLAVGPADTDLLLVLGAPGPELAAAVDVIWSQIPAPRGRVGLCADDVAAALDDGRTALRERTRPGAADDRPDPSSLLGKEDEQSHEGMDHGSGHEGMDHGGGHEGMDHGGGHEGMDHGGGSEGHHMHHGGEVSGLPMASTGPDRDGLELDVLKVSLGPVLPGWPTGLVLRAELQGDVLSRPALSWLDAESLPACRPDLDQRQVALDHLARVLVVAGWSTAARDARRARDGLRSENRADRKASEELAERVTRRVGRSRALAWAVAGTPVVDRLRYWCDVAGVVTGDDLQVPALEDVADMVDGAEIGTARLIVSALGLEPVPAQRSTESARA
ncbi:hypothetical protein DQ237_01185 [Blastococcus sp. TF02-8]|uniref:hypothetical protein n=1 Tax=Blastococcus sp. TF02-8 TaxID=2250574 RepID=UPI000DEB7144|nr:hypothetical protein [Blastococcus sp. TF02-8]RBY97585.1 hypothetical protein DQ237_01185 [Blastococcus sp. TF02-8]